MISCRMLHMPLQYAVTIYHISRCHIQKTILIILDSVHTEQYTAQDWLNPPLNRNRNIMTCTTSQSVLCTIIWRNTQYGGTCQYWQQASSARNTRNCSKTHKTDSFGCTWTHSLSCWQFHLSYNIRLHIYKYINTYVYVCVCVCVYIYIYTYIHTHTYTYIHIHDIL